MTVLSCAWSRKWSLQNRPRWCRSSRSSQHKSIWRLVHILTFNVDQFLALQDVEVLLTLQEWCEAGVIFVCASVFSSQCCLTHEFAMGMITDGDDVWFYWWDPWWWWGRGGNWRANQPGTSIPPYCQLSILGDPRRWCGDYPYYT